MPVRPRGSWTLACPLKTAKLGATMARLTAARARVSLLDGKETLRPTKRTQMLSSLMMMLARTLMLSPSSPGTTRIPVIPLRL